MAQLVTGHINAHVGPAKIATLGALATALSLDELGKLNSLFCVNYNKGRIELRFIALDGYAPTLYEAGTRARQFLESIPGISVQQLSTQAPEVIQ